MRKMAQGSGSLRGGVPLAATLYYDMAAGANSGKGTGSIICVMHLWTRVLGGVSH
jgi:hypothetical protein